MLEPQGVECAAPSWHACERIVPLDAAGCRTYCALSTAAPLPRGGCTTPPSQAPSLAGWLLGLGAGLSDVLDKNARNMARGEKARAYIRRTWTKPTLLLFGKPVRKLRRRLGKHAAACGHSRTVTHFLLPNQAVLWHEVAPGCHGKHLDVMLCRLGCRTVCVVSIKPQQHLLQDGLAVAASYACSLRLLQDPLFGSVQGRFPGLIYNAKALSYKRSPVFIEGAGVPCIYGGLVLQVGPF
jgi:hypothetical protein